MPLPDSREPVDPKIYKRPVRKLWMYTMPGITESLFLEACEEACKPNKLFVDGQLVNLDASQWEQLEEYCRKKLSLPTHWDDLVYKGLVNDMREKGWGTTFGPNPVINKKKLKQDKDIKETKKKEENKDQIGLF